MYDPETSKVGPSNKTLVTGMTTADHTTRTLLLSQKVNGTLLVSRGSTSNVDLLTEDLSSGHSQIKAFNLGSVPDSGYQFDTEGLRLGWGLRNSVGVAEHPDTGGIYSVENSVDQIMREGKDVHQDNPGEEMVLTPVPEIDLHSNTDRVRISMDISMVRNMLLREVTMVSRVRSAHYPFQQY